MCFVFLFCNKSYNYICIAGLVSRVVPVEKLLEETIKLAERIGTHSPLIVKLAKQAVNQAYETTLKSGLLFEKSLFYGTFATVNFFYVLCKNSIGIGDAEKPCFFFTQHS